MRFVYVGGTFDLFHVGHLCFLEQVKLAAPDHGIIVAVNSDEFAARYKRPTIMTQDERAVVLKGLRLVDHVVYNVGDEDSMKTVDWLQGTGYLIDFIAHGNDWTGENLLRQLGATPGGLASRGIEMLYVPYTKGVSSTDIRERVIRGYQDERSSEQVPANMCCGDPGDCSC